MNIEDIEQRLKLLVKLCHETEPTIDEIKMMKETHTLNVAVDELFTEDMLKARDLYNKVRDGDISSRREATNIMRSANTKWKQRNHIKEIGWKQFYSVEGTCVDLIKKGQKINAIKYYRQNKHDRGEDCGLKEAKEHIDSLIIKHAI